ncbi:hypothetical protein LOTGIDRAFT_227290 [Lottia gigantea]|uniref:Exonuclease domain-containing protein n=1 Tax=Lottia gigantea TaxID=225164 RepID=V4ANJ7_LOTGI|nr:hypothetical protein LOTGIDRAFT_227290 [Lottia gigantea]ESO95206.1 hypothetical protein LOTGIDRAFT_227290 [Lottia gigantea]
MAKACDSGSKIETLVIFDIEATGLPSPSSPPKITEFSMVAVNRNELLSPNGKPRVINKLQICVNPMKPIPQIVSELTGKPRHFLYFKNQPVFNTELVCIINGFLNRLPQPVCLVAHSGHGFDFPLLKAELERVGGALKDHVTCTDSLIAFRDLAGEEPWESHKPFLLNSNASTSTKRLSYSLVNLYTRVFGCCPEFSHTSEDDCMTLLALIQKHSPQVLYWIDSNHIPFKDVKAMH